MVNRRLMWAYAVVLLALAALAGLLILPQYTPGEPLILLVLIGLTTVLANLAVELPFAVSMTLVFSSVCAGIFYAGPWGGFLLGLAGAVSIQEVRDRKPVVLLLVNTAQLSLAGLISGWVYAGLGSPIASSPAASTSWSAALLAPVAAVTVSYVLNLLFVGVALHIKTGMQPREVLTALSPAGYLLSMLILALLGYVIAHIIVLHSWLGLLLLVLPFAMARRTFRVYVELTEAYTSTVRSLVTAIEAKDPYTRGHSERVADYAHRLAEHMGLPKNEVDLIERAALLHDVGKIGISLDTLISPEKLTPAEVNAIRQHPALGSDLVADVEFLSDIVDIVRHHHERCDGAGYPDGLVGEWISVPARILAVADAYDAMTSDRAYRPRMTDSQARDELLRVAGSQLDGEIVSRFTQMLAHEQTEQVSA